MKNKIKKLLLSLLLVTILLQINLYAKTDSLQINLRTIAGAGIVLNTLTPLFDLGLQYNKYIFDDNHKVIKHKLFQVSTTPYCFFQQNYNNSNIIVNDNWFVDAEWGIIYDHDFLNTWKGKESSLGIGYLYSAKGGIFHNTTYKLFTSILLNNNIVIVPELIFTNNLSTILPGISVKFF